MLVIKIYLYILTVKKKSNLCICSVYIDRHIRVDLSDDEQYVRNMPCYIQCVWVY